jgi:signal transduction histidine kinase
MESTHRERSRKFSVLVADDDQLVREVIQQLLVLEGHRVFLAEDGDQAWDLYRQIYPDIVVSDIKMPGLDGIELLERIRRVTPQAEVVLITGFANTALVIEALRKGVSNVIEKPFRKEDLLADLDPSFVRRGLAAQAAELQAELENEKRRVEMTDRMATLGRLLAGLSHEVHNPLTFLRGNAELVRILVDRLVATSGIDREGFQCDAIVQIDGLLRDMEFGTHRIQKLVEAMKRFGAPPAVPRRPVALADIMTASQRLVQMGIPDNVHLDAETPPAELFVVANPVELESCFVNLLVNAYEALEATGGRVRFHTREPPVGTPPCHGLVEILVDDDGPGISQDIMGDVFTPFFSQKDGGTGLGLSIAYQAAKSNGAQIEIQTPEGQGTSVIVSMPCKRSDNAKEEREDPVQGLQERAG